MLKYNRVARCRTVCSYFTKSFFFRKLFHKHIVKIWRQKFCDSAAEHRTYAMFLLHPTWIEIETPNYSLNTLCVCCKVPSLGNFVDTQ